MNVSRDATSTTATPNCYRVALPRGRGDVAVKQATLFDVSFHVTEDAIVTSQFNVRHFCRDTAKRADDAVKTC